MRMLHTRRSPYTSGWLSRKSTMDEQNNDEGTNTGTSGEAIVF